MEEDWAVAFDSKPVKDEQGLVIVRAAFKDLARILQDRLPQGRYRSIVKTELEKTATMATKAFTHT